MLWRVAVSRRCLTTFANFHVAAYISHFAVLRQCSVRHKTYFSSSQQSSPAVQGLAIRSPAQSTSSQSNVDLDALLTVVDFLIRRRFSRSQVTTYLQRLHEGHPGHNLLTRDGVAKVAWAAAESAQCRRVVGNILLLARKLGVHPRLNAFEGVVHRLAMASCWSQVPPIVALCRQLLNRSSKRLLNWKIRALIECSEWGKVETMLGEFREENIVPDRRTWHMLVQACLLNSNLPRARDYLTAMERSGFPHDDSTHVAIVAAYHALGQKDDVELRAFETIRGLNPKSDTLVLNSIMQLRMRHGDLDGMCRVFRVFTAPCNIRMTGVEMKLLGKPNRKYPVYRPTSDGDYDHVDATVVRPDATTFSMIMEVLAHQEEIDQVLRAYEIMRSCGIVPNATVIAVLIKAFVNVNDFEAAFGVFIKTCRGEGSAKAFVRFFHLYQGKVSSVLPYGLTSVPVDIRIYNALLAALLPSCGIRLFQVMLEHMRAQNVEPDRRTGNILLHYLSHRGFSPRQLINITTVFARLPPHCRPTIGHINAILASLMRRRRPTAHFTIKEQPQDEKLRFDEKEVEFDVVKKPPPSEPGSDPYDPSAGLASLYLGLANRELAQLLQHLESRELRSNSSTFALRLWRDAIALVDMRAAEKTFHEMVSRGIRPNARHFTILMDGFARTGDMRSAEGLLDTAFSQYGVLATVTMYTVLMKGYGRLRRPDLASRTFYRMMTAGVPPDVRAVLALVDAFVQARKYFFARTVLLTLWKWVIEFPPHLRKADLWTLRRAFASSQASHVLQPPSRERNRRLALRRIAEVVRSYQKFYQGGSRRSP